MMTSAEKSVWLREDCRAMRVTTMTMLTTLLLLGTVYHAESVDSNFCASKTDGYYADPETCTQFYQCANGLTHSQSCPLGTEWSQSDLTCGFPSPTGCAAQQAAQTSTQSDVTTGDAPSSTLTTQHASQALTSSAPQSSTQSDVTTEGASTSTSSPNSTSVTWLTSGGAALEGFCGTWSFSPASASCQSQGLQYPLPARIDCAFFCARMPGCTSFRDYCCTRLSPPRSNTAHL